MVDKSQRTSFIISYSLSTDDDVTSTIHSDFSKSSQFAVVKSFIAASCASLTPPDYLMFLSGPFCLIFDDECIEKSIQCSKQEGYRIKSGYKRHDVSMNRLLFRHYENCDEI